MSTVHTAIRIPEDDLAQINDLARSHGMSRTSFLIDAALNRLPQHQSQLDQRVQALEDAIERHERLLLGNSASY